MNKFIVTTIALFTVISAPAMELAAFGEQESTYFSRHLAMATGYGKKMVAEKKITEDNPIYLMLNKVSNDLTVCGGDLQKMIASEDLHGRIAAYKAVNLDPTVIAAKIEHDTATEDITEKLKSLKNARIFLSGELLKEKQAHYSPVLVHEVQAADRVNFMLRNTEYPLTEDAIKDYTALFIYQILLAPKV